MTHLPVLDERPSTLKKDGSRTRVVAADVSGRFATMRRIVFFFLILIYVVLPWIRVHGHPAVFIDIEHRKFFLFGQVFNPQDIWMLVFLVTGAMFLLVFLTAILGRAWCGWACPQTVFLEGVYTRIERLMEGPRTERLRRDAGPWTVNKVLRKTVKQALFVLISLVLAHLFLAYFVSIPGLVDRMRSRPSAHPESFLLVFSFAAVLYLNFAWFREQFCVFLCPYGRLQSILLDPDSLIVGYDETRGEPRAKGKQKKEGAGDCVDCGRCVVVCPTGIDIRHGLQMDCIACTACIDACDEIMGKVGRAPGLIRYDSQHGLRGETKHFFRPRLYIYSVLGFLGLMVAALSFRNRHDYEAQFLRTVGAPYTLDNEVVRNSLRIRLVNKKNERTMFSLTPDEIPQATFTIPMREVSLEPLGYTDIPVFVSVPRNRFSGEFPIRVTVKPQGDPNGKAVSATFLGPMGGS